ncbi:phage tail protein [Heliorestis acidaminivorans]|uniref:Phage tail protein n=1 Tax=Heliorestis acidaminivorans TaxID=553427 RepID=A0A6I0ER58_9FIRM|nr:phage tail protein [Heliorestis acidaminivorans]KAB2951956.1 phage tail protein [Heliorestis acidaminivorans]
MAEPALSLVQTYRFAVLIENVDVAHVSDVSGIDISVEVHEYREGSFPENHVRKIPGLRKFGNITLKGGVVKDNHSFYDWIHQNPPEQKNVTIEARDSDMTTVLAAWTAEGAFPVKYTGPEFSGTKSDIAFESLELAIQKISRNEA